MANQMAEMQRRMDLLEMGQNTSNLGFSSIENGSLVVYDANGDPRVVIGKQDDGTYVGGSPVGVSSPPEVPNPPTVIAGFGTVRVMSHGSSDPPWPRDFSHLNIYVAKGAPGGGDDDPLEPGVVMGTIIGTQDSMYVIAGLEADLEYRVWLTSVNISTAESDPSVAVTFTPTKVVGQDILDGAIGELQLKDDAVTEAKLAAGSVGSIQIQGEIIDVTKLADGSVDGDKIIASAIAAGHIAAGAITSVAIAANAIQAINIAADQILAEHLTAGSVTAEAILALAITADKIRANAVTAGAIAAGAITADKIQAGIVIADASLETGTSGRRVVISGPANEIRFMPQLNEAAYGRIFSYVSNEYPDDVNIEFRAIDSDEVNVLPRMFLTPNKMYMGLTDAADETINRGGRVQLEESVAAFGIENNDGTEAGYYAYSDQTLNLVGMFDYYNKPKPNDAVFTMNISHKNTGTGPITGLEFLYGTTMASPMAPVMSCGVVSSATMDYSIRDTANSLTGFQITFGYINGGYSAGGAPALAAGATVKVRAWVFRTAVEYVA
jgi:hypothetical protein